MCGKHQWLANFGRVILVSLGPYLVSVLLVFLMSAHLYLIQLNCHKVHASLEAFLRFVSRSP